MQSCSAFSRVFMSWDLAVQALLKPLNNCQVYNATVNASFWFCIVDTNNGTQIYSSTKILFMYDVIFDVSSIHCDSPYQLTKDVWCLSFYIYTMKCTIQNWVATEQKFKTCQKDLFVCVIVDVVFSISI